MTRGARIAACMIIAATLLVAACDAPVSKARDAAPTIAAPTASPTPPAPATTTGPAIDAGYLALDASVVAATDTLDTLRARIGAGQVVADRVPGAEGEEMDGWHLYPADPARHLYVYLDEKGRPAMLRVLDPESRWQRANDGIRMGRTLTELAARNGKPVGFTGFDWDYGGSCCEWNGGALGRDPPTGGMTLCPPPADATSAPGYPMGDAQFDSTNAWVVAHPPAVCEFSLALEPPP